MTSRFTLKSLIGLATGVGVLFATILWLLPGVTVTVRNSGTTPLADVKLYVADQTYTIGNLEGRAITSCKVRPLSEAHIEISYRLPDGSPKRHAVDCYIESGSYGTIEVEVSDGELVESIDESRMSMF